MSTPSLTLADFGSRLKKLAALINAGLTEHLSGVNANKTEKTENAEIANIAEVPIEADANAPFSWKTIPNGISVDSQTLLAAKSGEKVLPEILDEALLRKTAEEIGAKNDLSSFFDSTAKNRFGTIGSFSGESQTASDIYRGYRTRIANAEHEAKLLQKLAAYETSLGSLLDAADELNAQSDAMKLARENAENVDIWKDTINKDKLSDSKRIVKKAEEIKETLQKAMEGVNLAQSPFESVDYQREVAKAASNIESSLQKAIENTDFAYFEPTAPAAEEPAKQKTEVGESAAPAKTTTPKSDTAAKKTTTSKTTTKKTTTTSTTKSTNPSGKAALSAMPAFGSVQNAATLAAHYRSGVLELTDNAAKKADAKAVYTLAQRARADGASDDFVSWMYKVCGAA